MRLRRVEQRVELAMPVLTVLAWRATAARLVKRASEFSLGGRVSWGSSGCLYRASNEEFIKRHGPKFGRVAGRSETGFAHLLDLGETGGATST